MRTSLLTLIGLVLLPPWAGAELPEILNSEIETRAVESDLSASVKELLHRDSGSRWIAWSVPAIEGSRQLCCWGRDDRVWQKKACSLESSRQHLVFSADERMDPPLETRKTVVLLRAEGKRVDELRVFSESCRLDAEGRAVAWLEAVDAQESVALLANVIGGSMGNGSPEDLAQEALLALALHPGPAADRELARLAASGPSHSVREEAIFWLGEARGKVGLEALDRLLGHEGDSDIRGHVAFALTLSSAPGVVERLTALGRDDPEPEVREEALFWLGQEGGADAVDALLFAIQSDADRDVRRKAVFALSQVPDGKGTDSLLRIIQDRSQEASIRQEALFWLAQSDDDRALDLISEILRR